MKLKRDEVIKLELQLIDAIKSGDTVFIEKVLHDDLLFLAPNGQVITKKMDLASHHSGEMIVEHLIAEFEDFKIVDDTAISIVVYDTKGTMLGSPIHGQFRYIRNWKLFADGIKVISGACLKVS
tara:strand:+ start:374 stop:745 length:372 start_codon:yes stop_codon:yes gene_type:complete